MIKRGCDLIGLPVICLEDGYKTIEIKDILYCQRQLKIIAFIVEEGKYLHDSKIIWFQHIKSIGEDAITIESKNDMEKLKDVMHVYQQYQLREKLLGSEVVTAEGKNVGMVQDIMIEIPTGRLLGLILTEGLFDDLIDGRPILPLQGNVDLNKNTIIINEMTNQSIIYSTGGLKKIFSI